MNYGNKSRLPTDLIDFYKQAKTHRRGADKI